MIVFRIEIENRMIVTMFLYDVGIAAHYYIPRGHVQWSLPLSHKKCIRESQIFEFYMQICLLLKYDEIYEIETI